MLQTSARLLRLLTLMQGQRSWTGPELASRLDVTERTLRRDVDRLRSLGYPVDSSSGTAGGYSLGVGTFLPPLMLDDDEGVAVAVALALASGVTVVGIDDASQRALAKLSRVLPSRLRKRFGALRTSLVRITDAGPTVELAVVAALAMACAEHRGLRFGYRAHDGAITERSIEPHRLVNMGRRWYLVAWDVEKADWRTFRVDRMSAPIRETVHFVPRPSPDEDLVRYVTRAVASGPYRHSVVVALAAPIDVMRTRVSAAEGMLAAIDPATCRLSLGTNSLESTAAWLAQLGVDFTVESPSELARCIEKLAERLVRASRAR